MTGALAGRGAGSPRRWLLGGLVACLAAISTGCWDRIEVNDLAIVNGVALDRAGPQSVRMTVSVAVPSRVRTPGALGGGGTALPSDATVAAEGRTVVDAVVALQAKTGRRLFWGHIQVILVGDALARQGLGPVLDFFSRHRQPRLRTLIAVVPGEAAEVLATLATIEPSTATAIRELAMIHPAAVMTLKDFLADRLEQGREPVVPVIRVGSRGATQPGTLQLSPEQEPPPPALQRNPLRSELAGVAVFRGDRLTGYLGPSESLGLLWVRGLPLAFAVTVPLGEAGRYASLAIIRVGADMRPRFEGDRIVMEVRLFGEHELIEDAAGIDTDSPRVITLIEQELAEAIGRGVRNAAIKLQQELRSDAFGFGAAVRRADPARWRELSDRWEEVFRDVALELQVQTFIRRVGLSSRSMAMPRPQLLTEDELERRVIGR
ncbi:Ger(x)C family spore germination protein [Geochorda subterranea]|uniref:Ger(X)C family spore germination protein n=1 Tax=Geochorda subterranea TaxID=3109564 RepID=A0ABZ1BTR7_9FIRM|nr:Ger(x)C family spore germination protein [Limnochorda sp. LNt]WRP15517.1 Ger(x)C family spore germination protein [Limnochorda sp. LNt]